MSLQTLLLATLITGFGVSQYALMIHAMRDLIHRPRVRGGNKVLWGLAILCIPVGGALLYSWMGPTSFLSRPTRVPSSVEPLSRNGRQSPVMPSSRKITPIRPIPARPLASSNTERRVSYPGLAARSRSMPEPTRIRRTGS